jgi:predicted HAD superfamily Cof-like phosphohydrolase
MNSYDVVKIFMEACDQKDVGFNGQSDLYVKLIEEEFSELIHAYLKRDMIEIADACADLKWVIEGLEHSLEIPQQKVWDEVARSNLNKISNTGKVLKRDDGKVIKPEGWKPPNIKSILEQKE